MLVSAETPVLAASPEVLARAKRVRLVLTDCDGVLTDGATWVGANGEETKRFSVRDGLGVERLRAFAGVETGIVTRESGGPVLARARKLGIAELHLGVRDKANALLAIAARRGLAVEEIAYVGDDVIDIPAMSFAGLAAAPADALRPVRERAHFVCPSRGGDGAFRDVAELVLVARLSSTPL